MTHKIKIIAKTLSDGSEVFDVRIGNARIEAVTEEDALSLAERLRQAISIYSNDSAEIAFGYQQETA